MTPGAESLRNWLVPTAVSLIFTVLAGAVLWGQYSERVAMLENTQRDIQKFQTDNIARLSVHDTQIALINQKLDTIIQNVAIVNAKLDERGKRIAP